VVGVAVRGLSGTVTPALAGVATDVCAGVPDPDTLYADYHSKGASNSGKYSNPQVDQLLEQARTVQDLERRKAIYKEAQSLIVRDLPRVSAYEYLGAFATRANIANVRVSVIGDFTGQKWDLRNWEKR
jgi:ABC-type transport system substrate-binding protein